MHNKVPRQTFGKFDHSSDGLLMSAVSLWAGRGGGGEGDILDAPFYLIVSMCVCVCGWEGVFVEGTLFGIVLKGESKRKLTHFGVPYPGRQTHKGALPLPKATAHFKQMEKGK